MVMPVGTAGKRHRILHLTSCSVLVFLWLCAATDLRAAAPVCLRCHPNHYQQHGTCHHCHRGDARAARKELAHHDLVPGRLASFRLEKSPAVARGSKLADTLACRRCHRLGGRGNRLASDLDQAAAMQSVARLRAALVAPAWYMPDFHLAALARDNLLTYLLAAGAASDRKRARSEVPQVVHFAERTEQQDPFSRHCGGCHMTLTKRDGGLGRGKVAPNLAGLLGEFYPRSYGQQERWTKDTLKAWLKNPRTSRPLATMPPQRLSPQDYGALLQQLSPENH